MDGITIMKESCNFDTYSFNQLRLLPNTQWEFIHSYTLCPIEWQLLLDTGLYKFIIIIIIIKNDKNYESAMSGQISNTNSCFWNWSLNSGWWIWYVGWRRLRSLLISSGWFRNSRISWLERWVRCCTLWTWYLTRTWYIWSRSWSLGLGCSGFDILWSIIVCDCGVDIIIYSRSISNSCLSLKLNIICGNSWNIIC